MSSGEQSIKALHDALQLSPDNVPLRKHLADTLLSFGRADDAEVEYRNALALDSENDSLKLGLADAYRAQGKLSHALVIVEEMVRQPDTPPAAYLLHARLLLVDGDVEFAVGQYKAAVREDPAIADADLAERLGIDADETSDVVDGRVRAGWENEPEAVLGEIERPKIDFSDVGGMEPLKEEIRMKIIYPMTHQEMYKAYGKPIGGGILMYGPPGCGKTHLARATAGEIKAGFISVGINDVLEMWLGNSERNLHEMFDQARRNRPCVLFFDEVDALGASRADMRQTSSRQLINLFLSEMDGVEHSNEGVLILAATNAPWHLDSAFRRPGRFDRVLFVPPPDETARAETLRVLCRGKPIRDVDYDYVARKCRDFSGADMKAVLDLAIEAKLKEAMKTGVPEPLTTNDFARAAKGQRPTTKEWFGTARNYALYSNEGGLYDDILKYLKLQ